MLRQILKFCRCTNGSSMIEAAITLPIFFFLCLGVMEVGRVYWTQSSMQYSIDLTQRYISMNSTATDETISSYAKSNIHAIRSTDTNLSASVSTSTSGGLTYKTVTITYAYRPLFMSLSSSSFNLTAQGKIYTSLQ